MTSYTLMFIGDYTNAEAAVKAWDKAFRRLYNVYGGRRIESGKTRTGQFFVTMKYTARWANYPHAMKGRFQRVCDAAVQMLNRNGFDWDALRVQESKE